MKERAARGDVTQRRPIALAEGHLSEHDWAALLSAELNCEVSVRYGRARRSVIRVERRPRGLVLHLSSFFAGAPHEVRDALVRWLRSGKRARAAVRTLDMWIDTRVRELHTVAPRTVKLVPRGAVHDLADIATELAASEFHGEFGGARPWPALGWGRAAPSRSRRSLRLGSFDSVTKSVRVHPVLDSADAPRWFVRYVMFHELLHAVLDAPHDGRARRRHHGPDFRAREQAFADTARALDWEREQIRALIRCARAGKPFELAARPARKSRLRSALSWVQTTLFD